MFTRDLSQGLEPYTIEVSRIQLVENNINLGQTASSAVLVYRDRDVQCVNAALSGIILADSPVWQREGAKCFESSLH